MSTAILYRNVLNVVLCTILSFSGVGYTQNKEESINNLEGLTNDSTKVEILYKSSLETLRSAPKTSYNNFNEALSIINNKILIKNKQHRHFLLRKALILDNLSYNYRKQTEYVKSLSAIQQSLEIKEAIGETFTLSTTYYEFGSLYLQKKDSVKSKDYFDRAMQSAKKQNNSKNIAFILSLYSNYFFIHKELETAKKYAEKAYKYSDSIGFKRVKIYSLNLLSRYERRKKEFKASIPYSEEALQLSIETNDKIGEERSNKDLGYAYRKLRLPSKAIKFYEKSLKIAKEIELEGVLANRYLSLSNSYTDLKQHEIAFSFYRLYKRQQIKDLNVKSIKEFAELDIEYKYKKEKLKDSLIFVQEKKLTEAKIETLSAENKIKNQWLLFGGIGLFTMFLIIYLVRSKKFAVSKQELQEQFSQDLINEQEKERTRLARELHDSVGQKLMLLSKQTKSLGNANMGNIADSTLEEIRNISRGLHPSNLDRLGLTEAINALVYDINANTGLFFTEEIDNIDHVLSKESELHLYRIIQETLNNIVKHAEAKAVKLNIEKTKDTVEVVVSDNGKGFDFETEFKIMSLGLKTLFERAKIMKAQISLNSNKETGTEMILNIPIQS